FERGKGYWFLTTKTDATLFLEGESTPQNYRGNLFQITLQPEWNQIGNPYPVAINWSDVIDYNDNPNLGTLKTFNGGYADGNELKPYEGGFVRNSGTAPITITIPFKGQTTAGGRTSSKTFATELDAPSWMLRLRLSNGQISNAVSAIGMHPDASTGRDLYDDLYPPRFADLPELKFNRTEDNDLPLSKDLVPTQDTFTWSFALDATDDEDVRLEWDNAHFGSNDIELYLFDEAKLQLVDMRIFSSHRLSKDGNYKIYYGENIRNEIRPIRAGIANPYPNPGNTLHGVNIPYAVPEGGEHNVQLMIIDTQGRQVRNLLSAHRQPGLYEPSWDARDDRDQPCSAGLYLIQLTISSGSEQKQFYSRVILK
ncbi:MAG TPA: T9SS type A sorting domain-containing protein, partial [Sphingobacteriaceae bacterium]